MLDKFELKSNASYVSTPDSRNFIRIFQNFIEKLIPDSKEKIEIDNTKLLEMIKYPGHIKKNILLGVSLVGSWQNLIAILVYLGDDYSNIKDLNFVLQNKINSYQNIEQLVSF